MDEASTLERKLIAKAKLNRALRAPPPSISAAPPPQITPPVASPAPESGQQVPVRPQPTQEPAATTSLAPTTPPVTPAATPPVDETQPPEAPKPQSFGSLFRGAARTYAGGAVIAGQTGLISPETAAHAVTASRQFAAQYPPTEDYRKALQDYETNKARWSFSDWLGWMWDNPQTALSMAGESVGSSAVGMAAGAASSLAGGIAAGPPGAAAGLALGTAATSGASEYASSLEDFLHQKGFDLGDEKQWANAFGNPELMSEARAYALKRGVPVGIFDGLTSLIGARGGGKVIVNSLESLAQKGAKEAALAGTKEGVGRFLAEHAANTTIEGLGGAGGELTAEAWADGKITWPDVYMEFGLEFVAGAPEAAIETAIGRHEREGTPLTDQELNLAGGGAGGQPPDGGQTAPPRPASFEEARAQGRTLFGIAKEGESGLVPVKPLTGREQVGFEGRYGEQDPRQQRMVGIHPDDPNLTAQHNDFVQRPVQTPDMYTYTNPETEAKARALIDRIVALPTNEASQDPRRISIYNQAVKLGARLKPTPGAAAYYAGDTAGKDLTPTPRLPHNFGTQDKPKWVDLYGLSRDPNAGFVYHFAQDITHGDVRAEQTFDNSIELIHPALKALRKKAKTWEEFQNTMAPVVESLGVPGVTKTSGADTIWRRLAEDGLIKVTPNAFMTQRPGMLTVFDKSKTEPGRGSMTSEELLQKYATNSPSTTIKGENQSTRLAEMGYRNAMFGSKGQLEDVVTYKSNNPLHNTPLKKQTMDAIVKILTKMKEKFGITQDLAIVFSNNAIDAAGIAVQMGLNPNEKQLVKQLDMVGGGAAGRFIVLPGGQLIIVIDPAASNASMMRTAIHEMGHALSYSKFTSLPLRLQASIYGAYQRFLLSSDFSRNNRVNHFMRRRLAVRSTSMQTGIVEEYASRIQSQGNYYLSYEEWFAEQVARWGSTSRPVISDIARAFRAIAKEFMKLLAEMRKAFGMESFRPEIEMENWLEAMYTDGVHAEWGASARTSLEAKSRGRNIPVLGGATVPYQAATSHVSSVLAKYAPPHDARAPRGTAAGPPPLTAANTAAQANAHLDRMNWFHKMFLNFRQVARLNIHVPEVQNFSHYLEQAQLDANRIMAKAEERMRDFRTLRRIKGQHEALNKFIFELTEMTYLTPKEAAQGVRRWPTQTEFNAIAQRLGLKAEGLAVYSKLKQDFIESAARMRDLRMRDAMQITDQLQQLSAINQANQMFQDLTKAPYFPMTRFGKYTLTIRNANGKVESFETFENTREQNAAAAEALQQWPASAGFTQSVSLLPDDVGQFQGMPAWYLDKLLAMPGLTSSQQRWVEQLRFELAPSASFRKHLLRRVQRQGYSTDIDRVYARYFFKDARHYARVKWSPRMDEEINTLKGAHRMEGDTRKRILLADYLSDIHREFQNPSHDWNLLRSVASLWYLGGNVASAALNVSQLPIMAYPYLAGKFGDISSIKHLTQVSKDLSTYYKRGTYKGMQGPEMEAVAMAVDENLLTESMAAELAATSQSGNLLPLASKAGRIWNEIANKAMWMFQMTEQFNRRVTFRAAYRMAVEQPGAKWLQEVKQLNFLQYTNLRAAGRNDTQALAYLAGKQAIYDTMYDYSKVARPRFQRGRAGLLFTFYSFTQNTLFTLSQNKDMWLRYALVMTLLAGPMGLVPDDIEDILNFIGRKAFGGDFNLETHARQLVSDVLGKDAPIDAILHGSARVGFGIPALMDMIGVSWWPSFDRSQSVALNRILPIGIKGILEPGADYNKSLSDSVKDVAGAGFGIGFNLWEVLHNDQLSWGDPKRWEAALPRTLKNVTRAFRIGAQGMERDRNYNETIPFDMTDTEHVAELIGMALGYNPTRVSQHYDNVRAQSEAQTYWTTQRSLLLREAYREKVFYGDNEAFKETVKRIQVFNKSTPDKTLTISRETLKRSFRNREERRMKVKAGGTAAPAIKKKINELYPDATAVQKVK